MNHFSLLKTAIIGSVLVAICCFTPVLVVLLGILGLAAWVGYLDYILMPMLIFLLLLTVVAYIKRPKEESQ